MLQWRARGFFKRTKHIPGVEEGMIWLVGLLP